MHAPLIKSRAKVAIVPTSKILMNKKAKALLDCCALNYLSAQVANDFNHN